VPPKDSYTMHIPPLSSFDMSLAPGGSLISAIAWMDSSDCRTWNKGAGGGSDKGGPQCSQHELTITSNILSYDISAVEGVCGSHSIQWVPNDGRKPSGSDLAMNPPTRPGYGQCVPADKNDRKKWSGQDIKFAGCPWGDGPHKVQCHQWIHKHSYVPGGYCRWLYDSNSQAYCWAYDEMMCPLGRTCTYNHDGNPQIDGHGAYKKVSGAPTNPNVPRKGGKLVMSFLPLGLAPQPSPAPRPSPSPPAPRPSPSPHKWAPCSGSICCNPHTSVPQYCPGGLLCSDCGSDSCQCPNSILI